MISKLVRCGPVMLLVAGFALLGPTPRAHAVLTLSIQEDADTPITIVDQDANDTNPIVGAINVNVPAVNALLTQFTLIDLGSSSNSPGTTSFPQSFMLAENGSLFRTPGTAATPQTITIASSNTDYLALAGATGPRSGSSTANFTNAGTGDTQVSTVYNDPSNTIFGLVNPLGGPGSALDFAATGTPLTGNTEPFAGKVTGGTIAESTFSLTTVTTINLGPSGSELVPRLVQFSSAQTKQAAAAVPEPATMALVVTGLPVLGLGAWLRRRGKQA